MNNGHDWLRIKEVAEILSEVLEQPIASGNDGNYDVFEGFYSPKLYAVGSESKYMNCLRVKYLGNLPQCNKSTSQGVPMIFELQSPA